jgi:predicted phosphodiesterase
MNIGIITDIHENVDMLREAIKLAVVHKCDELVCLGDIVGYDQRFYSCNTKRSAKTCLDLIRSNCRWIMAGNHDLFAAGRMPAYSNGFEYPDKWFMMNAEERKKASRGKVWCYEGDAPNDLGEDELLFLKSLPEYITTSVSGLNCLFSHYIFPDFSGSTTRYIKRNHQLKGHWEFMNLHEIKFSFSGHSHTSFTGFAYQGKKNGAGSFLKAIHSVPSDSFNLGDERVVILLPPLAGEKGRTGFSIIDSDSMKLNIISTGII